MPIPSAGVGDRPSPVEQANPFGELRLYTGPRRMQARSRWLDDVTLDTMEGLTDLSLLAAAPALRWLSIVVMPQLTAKSFHCFLGSGSLSALPHEATVAKFRIVRSDMGTHRQHVAVQVARIGRFWDFVPRPSTSTASARHGSLTPALVASEHQVCVR
jgi:hypothetical protein